jgi:hypothetical protein
MSCYEPDRNFIFILDGSKEDNDDYNLLTITMICLQRLKKAGSANIIANIIVEYFLGPKIIESMMSVHPAGKVLDSTGTVYVSISTIFS